MNAFSVLPMLFAALLVGDSANSTVGRPGGGAQAGGQSNGIGAGSGSSRPGISPPVSTPRPSPISTPRVDAPRVTPVPHSPVPRSNGDAGASSRVISRPPVTSPRGDGPRRIGTGADRVPDLDSGSGAADSRSRATLTRRSHDLPGAGSNDGDRTSGGRDAPRGRDRSGGTARDPLGSSGNPYVKPAPRPHDGSPQHGSNLPSEDTAPRPHAADADRGDDHGGDPPADGGDQETDQGNHRDRERSDSRSWHSDSRSWRGSSWCNCWDWWFTGNCWHHWHFGIDPWFCCGSWFGWSWGYVFCGDPWNPWVWYYRPRYGASVYVYYPYPYHTYSYVNLDYVDETKTYPPLPSETYVDAAADLEQLLGQGKQLFRQADYLGAAEAFRQAILKDLTNPIAKFGYAHALFALGNYPFAALAIRLGMKLLPEWPILGGGLRDLYGKPDDLDGHLQALDHYLAQRPDDPAALLVLGYAQYFSGNLDRAAAAFERLTQLDAGDDVARRFLESANAIKAGQVAPPPATSTPPAPAKDH